MVTMKGNKPDYHEAMSPDEAPQFYEEFMKKLRAAYISDKVKGMRYYFD